MFTELVEASALSEGESGGVAAGTILNFEPQVVLDQFYSLQTKCNSLLLVTHWNVLLKGM